MVSAGPSADLAKPPYLHDVSPAVFSPTLRRQVQFSRITPPPGEIPECLTKSFTSWSLKNEFSLLNEHVGRHRDPRFPSDEWWEEVCFSKRFSGPGTSTHERMRGNDALSMMIQLPIEVVCCSLDLTCVSGGRSNLSVQNISTYNQAPSPRGIW